MESKKKNTKFLPTKKMFVRLNIFVYNNFCTSTVDRLLDTVSNNMRSGVRYYLINIYLFIYVYKVAYWDPSYIGCSLER